MTRVSLVCVIFMKLTVSPCILHSFHLPGSASGKSKSCVAPVEEPDTSTFPSPDRHTELSWKLCRSISCSILDLRICLTVLSDPTAYTVSVSGERLRYENEQVLTTT